MLVVVRHRVGHRERVGRLGVGYARLGLAARTVLVVRMLLHVKRSQALRLVDERTFIVFSQQFPFSAFINIYLKISFTISVFFFYKSDALIKNEIEK